MMASAVDAGVTYVSQIPAVPDVDVAIVRYQQRGVGASVNVHGQESRGQTPGGHPNAEEVGGPAGVGSGFEAYGRLPRFGLSPTLCEHAPRRRASLPSARMNGRFPGAPLKCDRMPLPCPLFSS